jgi:RimJ/RimL family protein N-acetyltransferase
MTDMSKQKKAAYRILTGRLLLRCWSPDDAPRLRAALDANDSHLRPSIPFMKDEPRNLYQTTQWLRGHRAAFDLDQVYRYAVFDATGETLLGENMLIPRVGPGGLEIGYWTDKDAVGRGIASEASCAMIRVAFEIEKVERVEIMCSPDNIASASIPAKLGFTHEATLMKRVRDTENKACDLMVWSLFAADYPSSPAAGMAMQAFDCLGAPIALAGSPA